MKINWKVRLKNKTWLLAFLGAIVAFIYQILGMLGIVAPVAEDSVTQVIALVINLLVALGIVQDPTTAGVSDSSRAMGYDVPAADVEDEEL